MRPKKLKLNVIAGASSLAKGFLIRTALVFLRSGADQKPLASEDVAGVAQ